MCRAFQRVGTGMSWLSSIRSTAKAGGCPGWIRGQTSACINQARMPSQKTTMRIVSVDAAVGQEGPVAAHSLDALGLAGHHQDRLLLVRRAPQQHAERIAPERGPPELDAARRRAFMTDAIDRGDEDAVGDGVRALD